MDGVSGKPGGQLIGDRLHPGRRNDRVAVGQHPEDDVEHPATVAQFRVELDAADEWSEEPIDHLRRETIGVERFGRRDVVARKEPRRVHPTQTSPEQRNAGLVEQVADGGCRRRIESGRSPQWVRHHRPFAVPPDERTRLECLEVERVYVELAVHLGVGRECNLEAAVECESVDDIAAYSTTDAVGCLVDLDTVAGFVQANGTRQSGQAGADDDDGIVHWGGAAHLFVHFLSKSRNAPSSVGNSNS